jgi:hypothetical protein
MVRRPGHVATTGTVRNIYLILARKPVWKKSVVRPIHKQEDNSKIGPTEMGCEDVDWIDMTRVRV